MKIILTKHCKQRRPHHEIKKDDEIQKWIKYFIDRFNIEELNNSIYKIQSKQYFIIFRLDSKLDRIMTIITFVNLNDKIYNIKENINFKIKDISNKEKFRLHRINFLGITVHCGNLTYSKDGTIRVKFRKDVYDKYDVPEEYHISSCKGALFNSIEECQKITFNVIKDKKIIIFKRKK